jgi:chemotaxis protein MotA
MFVLIGIVIVFGAIAAGYILEHGHIRVLLQPAELLIIGGAACGTVLISNPLHVLKKIAAGIKDVIKSSHLSKEQYLNSLKMMYEIFQKARKEGLVALEDDIEAPEKSPLFKKYKAFLDDDGVCGFVCDTIRMALTGGVEAFDIDQMMELDMEVHHHEARQPVTALSSMADSMPGFGIVAAVLGVVITMSSLGGPPEEIGEKVAAALVGTFLGILLCYGLVGPLAANMAKIADDRHAQYYVLRVMILAFIKGTSPLMAIEIGRRAIPARVRPAFQEVEKACRATNSSAASAASADAAAADGPAPVTTATDTAAAS